MFVTSDIYDLQALAGLKRYAWREQLVAGFVFHGLRWPGAVQVARFLEQAAKTSGLKAQQASYRPEGTHRSSLVKPASLIKTVERRSAEGKPVDGVLLSCTIADPFAYQAELTAGGEFGTLPSNAFYGCFMLPVEHHLSGRLVEQLNQLASNMLDADYGYVFVRDNFAGPAGYYCGIGNGFDAWTGVSDAEDDEAREWSRTVLTSADQDLPPGIRDVFQWNLLSEQHDELRDWIQGGSRRGRLEALTPRSWLWSIPTADIETIRTALRSQGLIKASTPRKYRADPVVQ